MSLVKRLANSKNTVASDEMTDAEAKAGQVKMNNTLQDFIAEARAGHLGHDAYTVIQAFRAISSGKPINDRELLLEHGLSMMQGLPANSSLARSVANGLIDTLFHDLPHPPATLASPQARYRSADGSGNCITDPEMGRAGRPYSRSVPALRPKPPNLPDPSLVFDMLMRRDAFRPHPSGLSSFFFSFATCVIHECFQTNAQNWWINETSSYVDLSTLYGNNQKEQDGVRTRNGFGTLWPDTIANARIMLMPPATVALIMLFNRNHNYVAAQLLKVNEFEWYKTDLTGMSKEAIAKQDEDIFQISRNITVALFAKVVLGDYVAAILNTHRANSNWSLDLGAEIRDKQGHRVERGGGNIVSVEFNALYHWHASLSQQDAEWTEQVFQAHFPNKKVADLTPEEFQKVIGGFARQFAASNPREWPIRNLTRGPDGRFADADLAKLIKTAIEQPAAAFGARGTPEALKVVEVMAMKISREVWNLCTMNEFRRYLNLTPFTTFKEWNSDEKIWKAAELLYGHVDNLELMPGLAAETSKPAMPGSGVCVGHTIGRGILDDAVSLVRSDRFLTHDFNTSTLTSWGVSFLDSCPSISNGGTISSVMFNALPFAFPYNSTYVLLPFYTPQAARDILIGNKQFDKCTDEPGSNDAQLQSLLTYKACKSALADRYQFRPMYNVATKKVPNNYRFFLDYEDKNPTPEFLIKAFFPESFKGKIAEFFSTHADYHIQKCSLAFTGKTLRQLDVVRDVVNQVTCEWIADQWGIPLITTKASSGLLSVYELRTMLLANFQYNWLGLMPKGLFTLTDATNEAYDRLWKTVTMHLNPTTGLKDVALDFLSKSSSFEKSEDSQAMYQTLRQTGAPMDELVANSIGLMVAAAGVIPNQTTLLINLYLRPENSRHRARICELVQLNTPDANDELGRFIKEGIRLAPSLPGLPRKCVKAITITDGDRQTKLLTGERLIIGTSTANMDPSVFPNPTQIDLSRPPESYLGYGLGLHNSFQDNLVLPAILALMKRIFKLDGLRQVSGRAGELNRIVTNIAGLEFSTYLDQSCSEQIAACNMAVQYDAPSADAPTGVESVSGIQLGNSPKTRNNLRRSIFRKSTSSAPMANGASKPSNGITTTLTNSSSATPPGPTPLPAETVYEETMAEDENPSASKDRSWRRFGHGNFRKHVVDQIKGHRMWSHASSK